MRKLKKPSLPAASTSNSNWQTRKPRDGEEQKLDPEVRQLMLTVLVKAESRLRAQYLNSWLKAMNDPEGTRVKAMMIEETFATIRGELQFYD